MGNGCKRWITVPGAIGARVPDAGCAVNRPISGTDAVSSSPSVRTDPGAHEKALAELRHGYAFDAVPSRSFAANSTSQILATLAHNLIISFQLVVGAPRRRKSLKRTALYVLKTIGTLRYELIARAGIVQYPQGRATLTLARNLPTCGVFQRAVARLASSPATF